MSIHEQVMAKVNAPVDKNLRQIVESLSLFPELQTLESNEEKDGSAWICFVYGDQEKPDAWRRLSSFILSTFGPKLAEEFGDRVNLSIQVTESGTQRAEMTVQKAAIPAVVRFLKRNSKKLAA